MTGSQVVSAVSAVTRPPGALGQVISPRTYASALQDFVRAYSLIAQIVDWGDRDWNGSTSTAGSC